MPRLISALLNKLALVRKPGWDKPEWLSSSLFALTWHYFPPSSPTYLCQHIPNSALGQAFHLYLSVSSFGLPLIPDVLPKKIISIEPCSATPFAGLQPMLRLMLTR